MNGRLVLAAALLAMAYGQQVITVTNGETNGAWGDWERCPGGSKVVAYDTSNDQVSVQQLDDSALNTIRLYCDDQANTTITSSQGS